MRKSLPRALRARRKRALGAILAAAAVAVIVAGCGGGSHGAAAHAGTPTRAPVAVDVRHTRLGRVLVDAQGQTLYLFKKDTGAASTCYGACASIWPPLTAKGDTVAGAGVSAGKLGTSKRSDGVTEVTYAGHPLYTYVGDTKPGDVNGQGLDQFGAEWDALPPSGAEDDD